MSTEQPVTTVENTDANQPETDNQTASDNSTTQVSAPEASVTEAASTAAEPREGEEESRPGGLDFGQMLDQFEQEQSSLQEGEVVRGTVIGITERGGRGLSSIVARRRRQAARLGRSRKSL